VSRRCPRASRRRRSALPPSYAARRSGGARKRRGEGKQREKEKESNGEILEMIWKKSDKQKINKWKGHGDRKSTTDRLSYWSRKEQLIISFRTEYWAEAAVVHDMVRVAAGMRDKVNFKRW
jgi:hypothetical protein